MSWFFSAQSIIDFSFSSLTFILCGSVLLCRTTVLQLGEVAEIEAQMFSFVQKFNRRTAVEFSNEPAILPNCLLCVRHSF
jgi:hypothetical protein